MNTEKIFINEAAGEVSLTISENPTANHSLILAHGAGAGMDHSFMQALAKSNSSSGIRVIRFNFPYKEKGKKMPGSPNEAVFAYHKIAEYVLTQFPDTGLFLSGKSYGGRMASHLAAENPSLKIQGLIYFGFPLHAPGKPGMERAAHLESISVPQLYLQGTNDALAQINLIEQVVSRQQKALLHRFEGADHSFKVKKDSGKTYAQVFTELVDTTVDWIKSIV